MTGKSTLMKHTLSHGQKTLGAGYPPSHTSSTLAEIHSRKRGLVFCARWYGSCPTMNRRRKRSSFRHTMRSQKSRVQFIHDSVRNFSSRINGYRDWIKAWRQTFWATAMTVSRNVEDYPFLYHATLYFLHHNNEAAERGVNQLKFLRQLRGPGGDVGFPPQVFAALLRQRLSKRYPRLLPQEAAASDSIARPLSSLTVSTRAGELIDGKDFEDRPGIILCAHWPVKTLEGLAKSLVSDWADPNAQAGIYGNALQIAAMQDHKRIVEMLLGNGADVNARGGLHGTALHGAVAALMAHVGEGEEVVEKLLAMRADVDANGADVNLQQGIGITRLEVAISKWQTDIVKMLVAEGADVHVQGQHYLCAGKARFDGL
ncbi:ankyrin repeat-containing domain protein [Immersiella caudata]|uniref:Ankyrin repeat-containing domain protein n=1 Tax=Immersiella caudata TaxID=314043 RepID=A0AA39WWQ6_9PEZI|nr:ankyrin repeat-containing domain protein [Immersiella caudata]